MIIFDLGTCVGSFVDFCLERYEIEVLYGFEPLNANYEFLAKKYRTNSKIVISRLAVSNFDGTAPFYKKWRKKGDKLLFDFAGNDGSSLKRLKGNVDKSKFDEVKTVKLSTFIKRQKIAHIDILKIDVEGSEYDIINDILDNNLHLNIDKIYYEDHTRKVPSIRKSKKATWSRLKKMGVVDKFYLQSGNNKYVPLKTRPAFRTK